MNEILNITINGQEYTLKFGYGCLRILSEKWGLPGVQAVFDQLGNMAGREVDVCVDLVWAAIRATGQEIEVDTVGDFFLFNPTEVQNTMQVFMASLPKAEPAGKQKAGKALQPDKKS